MASPGRTASVTTVFPLRRSNRVTPVGKVITTWSAMGSTTSCSGPCFQWAMVPLDGSGAVRSGTVRSTRAISASAGRRIAVRRGGLGRPDAVGGSSREASRKAGLHIDFCWRCRVRVTHWWRAGEKGSCALAFFRGVDAGTGDSLCLPLELTCLQRLLLARASSPIARGFAGQLPERRGKGGLGGIAKRRRDRHDRCVSVAQHLHGLLEPVLAQPRMR